MKVMSEYERVYYRSELDKLRSLFTDNEPRYTFEFTKASSLFHDRALLRKALRTLESEGLIRNINLGHNIHQWALNTKS